MGLSWTTKGGRGGEAMEEGGMGREGRREVWRSGSGMVVVVGVEGRVGGLGGEGGASVREYVI